MFSNVIYWILTIYYYSESLCLSVIASKSKDLSIA